MPLTDVEVKQAQPGQVLREGAGGLYLVVFKTGRKTWYRDFSLAGRCSTDKLGEYPAMSVRDARRAADDSRRLVAAGVNPNEQKRAEADKASLAAQAARQALQAQREADRARKAALAAQRAQERATVQRVAARRRLRSPFGTAIGPTPFAPACFGICFKISPSLYSAWTRRYVIER